MDTCIFCKIIKREVPSSVVYEDSRFIAFLSIDPRSPGHTLVVPKDHYRWVWDVPQISEYFSVAQKIAFAQRKAFGDDAICCHIEGEEVPHAHIWIYPQPHTVKGDKKAFEANANLIKQNL